MGEKHDTGVTFSRPSHNSLVNIHPAFIALHWWWWRWFAPSRRSSHRPLFDTFVFSGFCCLAALRATSAPFDRAVQLPHRTHLSLRSVSSKFWENLGYPANEQAARAVCFCALGKATIRRRWGPGNATEEGQRLAHLIHDQDRMKTPQKGQEACLL